MLRAAIVFLLLTGCASVGEPSYCPAARAEAAAHFATLPDWDVAWIGTALTQAEYSGPCPCPNSTAADGSQCGARSAKSKGAHLACHADEIPRADLPRIRARAAEVSLPVECGGMGNRSARDWPASPDRVIPDHWK